MTSQKQKHGAFATACSVFLTLSGCVAPEPATTLPVEDVIASKSYLCDDTIPIQIDWGREALALSIKAETYVLPRVISGSGARYADDSVEIWEHQGIVTLKSDAMDMRCLEAGSF